MTSDLAAELASVLIRKRCTLALAESCTGGKISSLMTDAPGASEFFMGCAVVYSNTSKERILGVSHGTIAAHGSVSAETAKEMATGARDVLGSDIAASVTGIAGPGGGSAEKPVGTVFIAVTDGKREECRKLMLSGSRTQIRDAAAAGVIRLLIEFTGGR